MYKAIQRSRLYEQIVQRIKESLLKSHLKPGDRLPPERELAAQFGVSRTAVREAVKTLREKGLVEAYAGRGTFVTDGTSKAIRQSLDLMIKMGQPDGSAHLAEVREILEPEVAALAATRVAGQHLAMMRDTIEVMDRVRHDAEAFIRADLDFHLALAQAAANPLILSLIDSIVGLPREQRMRTYYVDGSPERGQTHHKHILEAIERRDPDRAREAMRAHLRQIREDSRASGGESEPPPPTGPDRGL